MKRKTWDKKQAILTCGWCHLCEKELLSNEGGWIINGEKKYFCHDGKDGSCFDKYCITKKEKYNAGTLWKKNEKTYEQEKQNG